MLYVKALFVGGVVALIGMAVAVVGPFALLWIRMILDQRAGSAGIGAVGTWEAEILIMGLLGFIAGAVWTVRRGRKRLANQP